MYLSFYLFSSAKAFSAIPDRRCDKYVAGTMYYRLVAFVVGLLCLLGSVWFPTAVPLLESMMLWSDVELPIPISNHGHFPRLLEWRVTDLEQLTPVMHCTKCTMHRDAFTKFDAGETGGTGGCN